MKKNKQGFTLIELLVVIAIIGLLSTLSIIALNQARQRSRDARRLADVRQIQTALEMYYNDQSYYPAASGGYIPSQIASGTTVYMTVVPKPPLPGDSTTCGTPAGYTYAITTYNGITAGSYTLNYCLGSQTGAILVGMNTATPAGIAIQ